MTDVPSARCCDLCNPSLLDRVRPGLPPTTQRQTTIKKGIVIDSVRDALYAWRRTIKHQHYPKAVWAPQAILDNATCELLASVGPINTMARLEQLIRPTWHRWEQHSNELFELVRDLNIPPLPVNSTSKKRAATASSSQPATSSKRPRTSVRSATAAAPMHPAITSSSPFAPFLPVPSQARTPSSHSMQSLVYTQPYVPTPIQHRYPHAPPSSMAQYSTYNAVMSTLGSIHTPQHNTSFSTPAGINISTTNRFAHHPILASTQSSQFDSPAFNNSRSRQSSSNPHPYSMSAPHAPVMHFPPTPHFQTGPYSRPYLYTPPSHSYQSPPNPTFVPSQSITQHYTNQTHRYDTEITLDSSPFIIPSQHTNTLDRDTRPGRYAGSEVQYSSSNFPSTSNEDLE